MKHHLKHPVVRYGITAAILVLSMVYLSRIVRLEQGVRYLFTITLMPFIGAIGSYYLTVPLRTMRWRVLMSGIDVGSEWKSANGIMFLSLFFNTILPAKSGDAYRCYLAATDYGGKKSAHLGTVVFERTLDIAILSLGLLVVSVDLFWKLVPVNLMGRKFAAVLVVGLILVIVSPFAYRKFKIPPGLDQILQDLWRGVSAVRSPRQFGGVVVITIVIWSFNVVRMGFVASAVHAQLTVSEIVLIALLISFLTGLPYSPAGIGIVEAVTTSTLITIGLPSEVGLAFVLVDRLITVGSVIIVGSIYYLMAKSRGILVRRPDA